MQAIVEKEWPDIRKSDKKVRRAVQKALSDTSLRPIFETVVQRTTRSIKVQDSEIELAIDDGEVRAGGVQVMFRSVEVDGPEFPCCGRAYAEVAGRKLARKPIHVGFG